MWDFDRRLRSGVLQAMELIEVAVRTRVAFETGRDGPFAYLDPEYVEQRSIIPKLRPVGDVLDGESVVASDFELWAERVAHHETGSREEFAEHYRRKYKASSPRMPVWVSVELWDFGTLSRYYSHIMPFEARRAVSRTFGVENVRMFTSWIHALNVARNIAAHQSRLWNRKFAIQPKLPKVGVLTGFDHIAGHRNAIGTTIYPLLLIMVYLTSQLSPATHWLASVRNVLDTFPDVPGHRMQGLMGFLTGWENEEIWR